VAHIIDDYQDFPIFAPYYSWDAWRWVPTLAATAMGDDNDPKWPSFELPERTRENGRNESYKVTFVNADGKTREYRPKDEGDFRRFAPNSRWTLDVDRLGVIHDVKPR
jgi:hypothetical protein